LPGKAVDDRLDVSSAESSVEFLYQGTIIARKAG
jgi:hypothetical protein